MEYIIDNIKNYSNNKIEKIYKNIYKEKRDIISNYANLDDKKRSIISEHLLMKLFKKHNINYTNTIFKINENGKPYIDNLYFNISHKNDYIVAAVSNHEIGIDIETINDVDFKILKTFASNEEIKYVKDVYDFYKLYTLKEAYIKMKGLNITNIKDTTFILDKNIICSDPDVNIKNISDNNYIISIIEKK